VSAPPAPPRPPTLPVDLGDPFDHELVRLERAVSALALPGAAGPRWVATRLLELEPTTVAAVRAVRGGADVVAAARSAADRVVTATGTEPALLIADRRYAWAHRVARASVSNRADGPSRTDRLDDLLTHRWLGIPVFLGLMWFVFTLITEVAAPYLDWIDAVVAGPLRRWVATLLGVIGIGDTWVATLVLDGGLAGVGAVLAFVPVLAILYGALGVLEDSGYLARAAYLMDRAMAPVGLSGKSFLPLLLGFGCNVAGVSATRVLDRRRERIITALLLPFVSCAARLPVYVVLAAAFFPTWRGTVVFGMYALSLAMVLVLAAVLDRLLLRDERGSAFVLELPAYRRPSWHVLGPYVAQRVRAFVTKAGSVILVSSLVVWVLLATPFGGAGRFGAVPLEDSAFAASSRAIAPVLAPAGLGSWELTGTLLTGMVAKEVMVATLHQVYEDTPTAPAATPPGGAVTDLREIGGGFLTATRDAVLAVPAAVGIELRTREDADAAPSLAALRAGIDASSGGQGRPAAAALLVFVLLYVPCVATVGAIRQALGGRWAFASVALSLVVAWLAATAVFQLGRLLAGVGAG
jgi:ferrous iron transport protein B